MMFPRWNRCALFKTIFISYSLHYNYYHYCYFFDKHHRMMGMLHLISEFYPNSEMSSTLLKMKAVPRNAAFCKHGTTRGISIRFRCFSSSLETVPSAPTTIRTTTAFTSHCFSISIRRSWYFVIFSCSLAVTF